MSWHTFGQILTLWTLASVTVIGGPALGAWLVDLVAARRAGRGAGGEAEIPLEVADWDQHQHPAGGHHQHLVVIDGGRAE